VNRVRASHGISRPLLGRVNAVSRAVGIKDESLKTTLTV
jgi:hypothetical protein